MRLENSKFSKLLVGKNSDSEFRISDDLKYSNPTCSVYWALK